MPHMVQKQILITSDIERLLKQRSAELQVTESEVVRRALALDRESVLAEQGEVLNDALASEDVARSAEQSRGAGDD